MSVDTMRERETLPNIGFTCPSSPPLEHVTMSTPVITWTVQTPRQARLRRTLKIAALGAFTAAAAAFVPSPLWASGAYMHSHDTTPAVVQQDNQPAG